MREKILGHDAPNKHFFSLLFLFSEKRLRSKKVNYSRCVKFYSPSLLQALPLALTSNVRIGIPRHFSRLNLIHPSASKAKGNTSPKKSTKKCTPFRCPSDSFSTRFSLRSLKPTFLLPSGWVPNSGSSSSAAFLRVPTTITTANNPAAETSFPSCRSIRRDLRDFPSIWSAISTCAF